VNDLEEAMPSLMIHLEPAEYEKVEKMDLLPIVDYDINSVGKNLRLTEDSKLVIFRRGVVI